MIDITCLLQNTMNESLEGLFPLIFNDLRPLRVSDMLRILKLVIKLLLTSSEVNDGRIDMLLDDLYDEVDKAR